MTGTATPISPPPDPGTPTGTDPELPVELPSQRALEYRDPLWEREVAAAEASARADTAAAEAQRDTAASQLKGLKLQTWSTGLAVFVALIAALQGTIGLAIAYSATQSQAESVDRQNRETRLATAMEALGSADPAARIGGYTLLQRNIEERMAVAESPDSTPGEREDAVVLYSSAIDLVENYLKSPERTGAGPDGVGRGVPAVPAEVSYVVNRLSSLLRLGPSIEVIRADTSVGPPNIDLAKVELYRSSWSGTSFAQLPSSAKYFPGIDLRGASFADSDWTKVYLRGAHLQCATVPRDEKDGPVSFRGAVLENADLRGAELSGADLTDANLTGADLRGANLNGTIMSRAKTAGAKFDDTYGTPFDGPPGLGDGKPGQFSTEGCLTSPAGLGLPTDTTAGTGWVRPPGMFLPVASALPPPTPR